MSDDLFDESKQRFVLLRAPSSPSSSWRALTASDASTAAQRSSLAAQLHDAVAYLHGTCHAVHGYISPSMCLVDVRDPNSLRLVIRESESNNEGDLVLVNRESDAASRIVQFAPEFLRAEPARKSVEGDVYAYGIVLYWLATGREPFVGGAAASRNALLHAITKQSATTAMPLSDDVPLQAEIRAATRHKPSKRKLVRPAVAVSLSHTFKQRAAGRQSRAVPTQAASPRKLTAREMRERHVVAPIVALGDATAGEREAFEALMGGGDAGAILAALVGERAQEGLFRVPGDASQTDAYKAGGDGGAKVLKTLLGAPQLHAHTLASLFKQLLRQHSGALVPAAADRDARELLQLSENAGGGADSDAEVLEQLRQLLHGAAFSAQQRLALRHVARAFHALVAVEEQNKMSLPALLTCVGPSLQCSPGWLKWAVMRFDSIFSS